MIHLFWAYSHGLTEDRLRLYYDAFAEIPAVPPQLDEQERIVAVLDACDQVIEQTERLIAVKRQHKGGIIGRSVFVAGNKRGFIRDLADINPINSRVPADTAVSFVGMEDVSESGVLTAKKSRVRNELGSG